MFLVRIVSAFGTVAVAGYMVAVRIIIVHACCRRGAWPMRRARSWARTWAPRSPIVRQRSAWLCGHYNMFFMVCVTIFFWIDRSVDRVLLHQRPAVADAYGVSALRDRSCLGYFFYGYGMVLSQAFNGAGDTLTPTWMNVICFWLIEIPLAWFLARTLGWGPHGVFASIAISESLLAVLCASTSSGAGSGSW